MPRTAEIPDDPTDGATVHASVNGINEAALKAFIAEYEAEDDKINAIMADAEAACQPHRDRQKEIKTEAAEASIPKKPFAAKLRERALRRRAERVTDALSEDQKAIFAEISAKLGDMNLFEHALNG